MRRFDSRFIHFEVPEGSVEDGPTGEAPAVEAPAAEATPEWVSREDYETLGDHVEQLTQHVLAQQQPQQPEPTVQPEGPEWDPLNPDAYLQHQLKSQVQEMFDERMGAIEPIIGQVAEQQGEAIARQTFEKIQGEVGQFDHDQALVATQSLIAAGVDPLQAVEAAARQQHQFEQTLRAQWAKEQADHVENLRQNPDEQGTSGAALEQQAPATNAHESAARGASRYEDVGLRLVESRRPSTAA